MAQVVNFFLAEFQFNENLLILKLLRCVEIVSKI